MCVIEMQIVKTIKDSVLDFGNWVRTGIFSVSATAQGISEMKAIEKTSTIKALFLTSDRGIFGIDEELYATIDHERDICVIHGLDRAFFGNKKTGVVTYTTLKGQRYALLSDGQHVVLDHMDPTFSGGNFTSKILNLSSIYSFKEVIDKIPAEKRAEWEDLLTKLDLKKLGICLDLNVDDDHTDKKDLSVWAIKAMAGGFFKSLTQTQIKMIIIIGLCCWLLGIVMAGLLGGVGVILTIITWLIFH
jgi:hypothetical protein